MHLMQTLAVSALALAILQTMTRAADTVVKPTAMACTSSPYGTQAAMDILKAGGNAVDAAIAMNAAEGVVEPMSGGMGGDLYALVWDNKTQKLYALNSSGRAPYAATIDYFKQHDLATIPTTGPLSWNVPGCVDGWDALRKKFGTMPFDKLLAPAINYARDGFAVTPVIAGYWDTSLRTLEKNPEMAATFVVNGRAPKSGETFKNPRVAATLEMIAKGGRDVYYKGPIAQQLVEYSQKNGGLFSLKDFTDTAATWVDPVSTNYHGYDVWELPPPTQGIATLQMLNILENFDLKKMGAGSADFWQVFVEAKKLAYADRAKYYTDPDFAKVPVAQLLSKEYAAARAKTIDMKKAAIPGPGVFDVKLGGETMYMCVVDKDRNCVSLIQSNYEGFGSGYAGANLGFGLQNRGCLFSLNPQDANKLEPHKRPFHTIIPSMVTRDGKPYFVFGVMGGDYQPEGQCQVLCNLIDFGMDVQQAGDTPRIEHVGSATPTGTPAKGVGTLEVEPAIPQAIRTELQKRGNEIKEVKKNGGGYQAILIDPKTGDLRGGSESRKDGRPMGY